MAKDFRTRQLDRRLVGCGLAAIVTGAMALSTWWLWRIPIFQAPDENIHFDYVMSLRADGGLLRAADRRVVEMAPGGFFHPFNPQVHPVTFHLETWARTAEIRHRPNVKVAVDYGSTAYFAAIDQTAPPLNNARARDPFLVSEYPVGYYGMTALWIFAWGKAFPGVVAMFFAARAFSVLLLGIGLVASFATIRHLGTPPLRALGVIAAVGFFPLTSFVSSYVQSDNFAFAALALCLWLALRASQTGLRRRDVLALGLALALVLQAKLQVFVAVVGPVVALTALAESRRGAGRWIEWGLLLLGPSLLAAELQLWVSAGGSGRALRNLTDSQARAQVIEQAGSVAGYLKATLPYAARNFFGVEKGTFRTFWATFGWNEAPWSIGTAAMWTVILRLLQVGSLAMLALLAWRVQQVVSMAVRQWRQGRSRRALKLLVANPLVPTHALFAILIVVAFVVTNNNFSAQGRNWYALLPIVFWGVIECAPRALGSRRAARWLSNGVLSALLLYCLVGGYSAVRAIEARYYGTPEQRLPALRWP